jgi:hypothetical protein
MIDCELAKKLKDAGFPQHTDGSLNTAAEPAYIPTLEELLEACMRVTPKLILEVTPGKDMATHVAKYWLENH